MAPRWIAGDRLKDTHGTREHQRHAVIVVEDAVEIGRRPRAVDPGSEGGHHDPKAVFTAVHGMDGRGWRMNRPKR